MQFVIPLEPRGEPLFRQVYVGLRQAILAGTFRAGDRLPSTRDLAEQLGISRTVVVLAYEHLLAEGFVVGRVGSGTYVPAGLSAPRSAGVAKPARLRLSRFGSFAASAGATVVFPEPRATPLRYDFAYGRSDVECFPFDLWQRILHRRTRQTRLRELDYGPAAGSEPLREAICA
ncbi:MAG: GntR family transcriptional regulator, partial [bacterium]